MNTECSLMIIEDWQNWSELSIKSKMIYIKINIANSITNFLDCNWFEMLHKLKIETKFEFVNCKLQKKGEGWGLQSSRSVLFLIHFTFRVTIFGIFPVLSILKSYLEVFAVHFVHLSSFIHVKSNIWHLNDNFLYFFSGSPPCSFAIDNC